MAPPPEKKKKRTTSGNVKRGSVVWDGYFDKFEDNKARCTRCSAILSTPDGSTSNLHKHYESFHAKDYKEMLEHDVEKKEKKKEDREIVQEAIAGHEASGYRTRSHVKRKLVLTGLKDPSSSDELPAEQKYVTSDRKQLNLDLWLTQFFTESGLSFEIVETGAFKDLFLKMMPKANILSEADFVRTKLPRLHDGMEQELRTKAYNGIKSNPTHAFASFDFWVDNEKNTYWSAFAHFVDRQWKAHTILLFQQCLTSKPLETFLSELDQLLKCDLFDNRLLTVIYDKSGDLVMKEALKKFQFRTGLEIFRCIRTRFADILKTSFDAQADVKQVMEKVVEFGHACNNEPFVWELIMSKVKANDEETINARLRHLKGKQQAGKVFEELDMNNIGDCIGGMLAIKEILIELEKNTPLGYRPLSEDEWELLVDCQKIVYSLEYHRVYLANVDTPACNLIPAAYTMREAITGWLEKKKRDARIETVAKEFLKALEIEFPNNGTTDRMLCLANLLHPFYRGHPLKLVDNVETETIQYMVDSHNTTMDWRKQQAELQQVDLEDRDDMDRYVFEQSQKTAGVSKAPIEVEFDIFRGLPLPAENKDTDVLKWWKENKASCPMLAELAREVLSMPGVMPRTEFQTGTDVASTEMFNYCNFNWDEAEVHAWDLSTEMLEQKSAKKAYITKKALEEALAKVSAPSEPIPSRSDIEMEDEQEGGADQAPEGQDELEGDDA